MNGGSTTNVPTDAMFYWRDAQDTSDMNTVDQSVSASAATRCVQRKTMEHSSSPTSNSWAMVPASPENPIPQTQHPITSQNTRESNTSWTFESWLTDAHCWGDCRLQEQNVVVQGRSWQKPKLTGCLDHADSTGRKDHEAYHNNRYDYQRLHRRPSSAWPCRILVNKNN
jgi:hypothetical protein